MLRATCGRVPLRDGARLQCSVYLHNHAREYIPKRFRYPSVCPYKKAREDIGVSLLAKLRIFHAVDMQDRCLYCGASEHSFIHPEYNCKWVRIVMHGTGAILTEVHACISSYVHACMHVYSVISLGT